VSIYALFDTLNENSVGPVRVNLIFISKGFSRFYNKYHRTLCKKLLVNLRKTRTWFQKAFRLRVKSSQFSMKLRMKFITGFWVIRLWHSSNISEILIEIQVCFKAYFNPLSVK